MSCNAFSLYTNIFGIITGSVSLITVAFGFQSYLPSNRIKTLDNLLEDTEKILISAIEDGLLPEVVLREQAYDRLSGLREDSVDLRTRAYCATTWTQDCTELFMGLSAKIGRICKRLKKLRAEIVTSSEAQRRNIRHSRSLASSSGTPAIDCNDSLDDRTNSDATSITISECPEIRLADDNTSQGRVKVFPETFSDVNHWPNNVLDHGAESSERRSLQWNESHSKPADVNEAGTHDQIDEANEPVPRVNLPVTRADTCCTLSTRTTPSETLDPGDHGRPQGCSAEPSAP